MITAIRLAQILSLGLLLTVAAQAGEIEEGVIAAGFSFGMEWKH